MSHSSSKKAVLLSLISNGSIAVTKVIGAIFTGSGSMMAEAIHSVADCGNQALLMVGMKRSQRAATIQNPLGYAREMYFWSMMVAVLMFFLGGVFSLYEGFERLLHPQPVEYVGIAVTILVLAVIFEWISLRGALFALKEERGNKTLWRWFRETRSSELMIVTGEDIAALAGLTIALVALGLTMLTGNSIFDAVGSLIVGLLLVVVAMAVTRELHGLIVGEAADSGINVITSLVASSYGFVAFDIIAVQHGHEVKLTMKIEPLTEMTLLSAMNAIVLIEADIQKSYPSCRWIFTELGRRGYSPT